MGRVGCLLLSRGGALSLGWAAAGALRRAVAGVGLLRGAGGAEGAEYSVALKDRRVTAAFLYVCTLGCLLGVECSR